VKATAAIISFLLAIVISLNAVAQSSLDVYSNGGDKIGTLKILDNQGTEYVLVEEISKIFGGTRQNQPLLRRVTLIMMEKRIVVTLDRNQVKINDNEYALSKPSANLSGKMAVPIDFLLKILTRVLGKRVILDLEGWTLEITDKPFDKQAEREADLGITSRVSRSPFRMIIDPGHGGFDVGARSKTGTLEKDLTLEVAQKTKELLEENEGIEVFLTRNEDRFLTPEERVNTANNLRGNALLSIHFNWSPSQNSQGFNVFINSDQIHMAPDTSTVSMSGADMFTGQSKRFAGEIKSRLSGIISTGGKDKAAPLTITNGLFMPGVLVELLYLSNSKDLDILSGSDFVNTVAASLSESILAFSRAVAAQKASLEND